MTHQLELRMKLDMVGVDWAAIDAQSSMTKAIALCQQLGGLDDKELVGTHGIVKDVAQWSRIKSGQHYFPQDKLCYLMDLCRNEAPLFWLARQRGYELQLMETEVEKQLRVEREARKKAEERLAYLESVVRGR